MQLFQIKLKTIQPPYTDAQGLKIWGESIGCYLTKIIGTKEFHDVNKFKGYTFLYLYACLLTRFCNISRGSCFYPLTLI